MSERGYARVLALTLAVVAVTSAASAADKNDPKKKKGAKPAATTATPTPSATATTTVSPTASATVTTTPTVTATSTPTVTPTPTATATVEAVPAVAPGEAVDRPGVSLALLIGFDAGGGGYSGFATGVRGGYTLPFHLYVGGGVTFYVFGGGAIVSIAPEVGYDIALPVGVPLLLRPYAGIGFVDVTTGVGAAFEVYPGTEMLYSITPNFFVGGDVRVPILFLGGGLGGGTEAAINLFGTIGYKF